MLQLKGYLCVPRCVVACIVSCLVIQVVARAQGAVKASPETQAILKPVTAPTQLDPIEAGNRLVSQGQYQAAIDAFKQAPQLTARAWNEMGVAYQMIFDTEDAIRSFSRSLKLNPSDSRAVNNLGVAYMSLNDHTMADRMYRKAIRLDPDFALAYKNLGTDLITQGEFKKGQAAYAQAMALNPGIFTAGKSPSLGIPASVKDRGAMHYSIAEACARAGRSDCALEFLRTAINEGFADPKKVASTAVFATLSQDPRFQKLVAEETNR
jgi:Flp pilus assembly protein TadD